MWQFALPPKFINMKAINSVPIYFDKYPNIGQIFSASFEGKETSMYTIWNIDPIQRELLIRSIDGIIKKIRFGVNERYTNQIYLDSRNEIRLNGELLAVLEGDTVTLNKKIKIKWFEEPTPVKIEYSLDPKPNTFALD